MIDLLLSSIGLILMFLSLFFKGWGKKPCVLFILGLIFVSIGLGIAIMTIRCKTECLKAHLIFQGQGINCQGELDCYCKAPPPPIKTNVVVIE